MAPSETANNVIGALGGATLAACLAPQLLKLYLTKSAKDLSFFFLALYGTGCLLSFVYLYYEGATVAWISILVEVFFSILLITVKLYLDTYGPYSKRGIGKARRDAVLSNSTSFATRIKLEAADFIMGTSGAPFPLIDTATDSHLAQHLLLDCKIPSLPVSLNSEDVESKGDKGTVVSFAKDILETSLTSAGVMIEDRKCRSFYSNSTSFAEKKKKEKKKEMNRDREEEEEERGGEKDGPTTTTTIPPPPSSSSSSSSQQQQQQLVDHMFYGSDDGYVTCMIYNDGGLLSADFISGSEQGMVKMREAAKMFCKGLVEREPGVKISASVIARLSG